MVDEIPQFSDLGVGQNHWPILAHAGTNRVDESEILSENSFVEKNAGAESLVLSARGDLPGDRKFGQKVGELSLVVKVKLVVVEVPNEATNPADVSSFR